MRTIKKRLALCHIGLMIGLAAIAIPVDADIDSTAKAVANERHQSPDQPASVNEVADTNKASNVAVFQRVTRPQDDFYDLRREHWEDRLEGRLEYREEYLEEQTGDNDDDADAKDSKAGKEDDDSADKEQDIYEQRREYWRQRLDKEW